MGPWIWIQECRERSKVGASRFFYNWYCVGNVSSKTYESRSPANTVSASVSSLTAKEVIKLAHAVADSGVSRATA